MGELTSWPIVNMVHRYSNTPDTSSAFVSSSPRIMSAQMTPRRGRRVPRASTAYLTPNKENLHPTNVASTSAKTLDLISNVVTSSPSPSKRKSPFGSALRRCVKQSTVNVDQDEALSSSEESDDSAVVFFGQPSSAEKKRRVRYEQRVIEKRLRHKDSLDLTRQRPISHNPDDTMLFETTDQQGWSLEGPTPAPARSAQIVSSPQRPLRLSPVHAASSQLAEDTDTHVAAGSLPHSKYSMQPASHMPNSSVLEDPSTVANPFLDWSSPRKSSHSSPQKLMSPVRSVETLIDATLGGQRTPRSARRSPRLSLRRLQQSVSPVKIAFETTIPQGTNITPATSKHFTAPPPSTGLSGFACLRIASACAAPVQALTGTCEEQASPSMRPTARSVSGCESHMNAEPSRSDPASPVKSHRPMDQSATPSSPAASCQIPYPAVSEESLDGYIDDISVIISKRRDSQSQAVTPALASTLDEPNVSPAPVFRQTARRVPIHQHEAEFGVKLSPEKRGSPYKGNGKSSALRTQEPTARIDRIPARRVHMQVAQPATDPSVTSKPSDAAVRRPCSVASKAARATGPMTSRLGSRGASSMLPPAMLSRAVPAPASASVASNASVMRAQSVASKPSVVKRAYLDSTQSSPRRATQLSSALPRLALSNGSRLPRPASGQPAQTGNRPAPQTRPVPMAIARLPPSAQATAARSAQALLTPSIMASESLVTTTRPTESDNILPMKRPAVSSPRKANSDQVFGRHQPAAQAVSPPRSATLKSASPTRRTPVKALSPAKVVVVRDPEQQRLRCLAMQERARNRPQRSVSGPNSQGLGSAEVEGIQDTRSSPIRTLESPDPVPDAVQRASSSPVKTDTEASVATGPRSLRASRSVRMLTPSAQRIPAARGRALSLNDIIAARKVDLPLTLADQLRLADTVNKKQNEKTLAKYKITKVQRPYERPPSPDQHIHEPDACVIVDDQDRHRKGKGDLSSYSTPPRARLGHSKSVKWYRPLFVDQGSHYGNKKSETRPALKAINYHLDKLGNKIATGSSPKLAAGQPVIIYRNFFKGEIVPDDL